MQARNRTSNELRCFCSRQPLLATYGIDEQGNLYVHVKVFKQQRIFGEVLIMEGIVKLHCRECLRWHQVIMRMPGQAELEETVAHPIVSESLANP